jgi:uncharacterized RDD family membrane protein YckC
LSAGKPKTYYELLGVSFYASEDDIRRGCESALRRLDQFGVPSADQDPQKLAEIGEKRKKIMQAYMTLKDHERRQKYNAALTAKLATANAALSDVKTGNLGVAVGPANVAKASPASTPSVQSTALPKHEAVDLRETMAQRRNDPNEPKYSQQFDADDREYAHIGVRFTAMLIDTAIVMVMGFAFIVLKQVFGGSHNPMRDAFSGVTVLGLFALATTYYVRCESGKYKSTWGKRWMGLEVSMADSDEAVGRIRAFFRYLLRQVSANLLMLGYVMAFFTERKQALHDKVTDSVVMRVKPPPSYWPLLAVGLTLIVPAIFAALTLKVARNSAQSAAAMGIELAIDDREDPSRATPTKSEVEIAFASGVSLQNALRDYYAAQNKWPGPKETEQIIAQATRSESLRTHNAKLWPDGFFALSLGATANGTARLIFTPESVGAKTNWHCSPINIAEDMLIAQCGGE